MPREREVPQAAVCRDELLEELGQVLDPELDESILERGFVESLQVQKGSVTVELRLPTFWCAATFAYLMAEDIRKRLLAVHGVTAVTVGLKDHFESQAIETAVNAGKRFSEAFPGEATADLDDLRLVFLRKGLHQAPGAIPTELDRRRFVVAGDSGYSSRASVHRRNILPHPAARR